MKPRRQQRPITFRSDRAARRLALLTRSGRSQAEIIEEALDRIPLPPTEDAERQAFLDRIDEITRRAQARGPIRPMQEFDDEAYDEKGLPR